MKYLIAIIFLFNIVILNLKNFYHENLAKLALFINKNKYYLIIIRPESFVAPTKSSFKATKLSGVSVHKRTEFILF